MATYTPLPEATVEAFQWIGDPLADYTLPGWANGLALHAPTDQMLHVPCYNGTFAARVGDWIVRDQLGNISVVPNAIFELGYNVFDVQVEETRKTADVRRAEAAELRASVAEKSAQDSVAARSARSKGGALVPVPAEDDTTPDKQSSGSKKG